ncbi:chemotaxis protein CheD [Ideonella azotifigens]|uniref:Probable chemoreceptor glutamine deamidase CheD n=1 Tax=Ideonella azotifigens TaxID=513160 RepID=A0ABP3VH43_9BURK|nr:chemotaxis protein CheD [Ideonella azotifigens]MCD2344383.1 chemotaxis protein CheD [Ideonella azotifigens]
MDPSQSPAPPPSGRQGDVFLQPGEFFVGDAQHRIRTLLGSCVSITLWCATRRMGAMSHFLLAKRGRSRHADETLDGRYADEALRLMLDLLARRDVKPADCQAKIFGGGEMFPENKPSSQMGIGRRNGEAARRLLQGHGIQVVSESLFGNGHRQIIFDVGSGDVWARQMAVQTESPVLPALPFPLGTPLPSAPPSTSS